MYIIHSQWSYQRRDVKTYKSHMDTVEGGQVALCIMQLACSAWKET